MKIFANLMLVVTAATLLTSCNSMDDQTIVIPERQSLANPSVVKRDFKRINSQHKVLVGIIDSGVDYNQPLLVENIHFKLNDFVSLPSGFGYDVSGEDVWASPFIARTSDYNPEIGPTEKLKSQTEANNIAQLLRENPEFESFLNPLRHNVQEIETSAYHGTHVAGLASYDDPEIGILGYRVIPFSSKYKNGELLEQDMGDLFIDQIIAGSSAAVRDGARVLNMSLGMIVDKNYEDLKKSEESETKHKARVAKLRQFALANPDVVIVVAAGNDGKWVDQDARLGLPCGTDAPNILCVGATDENGKIASFTNILMTEGAFIFGYGVNVLSTVPESLCTSKSVSQLANQETFNNIDSKAKLVAALREECRDTTLTELSGTSMASPIIARQVAKILIEKPTLSGAQAIQTLLSKAQSYKLGAAQFASLRVEKPSWSKKPKKGLWLRRNSLNVEKEYFDFIVPQSN